MTEKEYLNYIKENDCLQERYLSTIGLILYSIRSDWSNDESVDSRLKACLSLIDLIYKNCFDIEVDSQDKIYIDRLRKSIQEYRDYLLKGEKLDGRYFRDNFPSGYIGILPEEFGELEDE